jgi:hypothetical protein
VTARTVSAVTRAGTQSLISGTANRRSGSSHRLYDATGSISSPAVCGGTVTTSPRHSRDPPRSLRRRGFFIFKMRQVRLAYYPQVWASQTCPKVWITSFERRFLLEVFL